MEDWKQIARGRLEDLAMVESGHRPLACLLREARSASQALTGPRLLSSRNPP